VSEVMTPRSVVMALDADVQLRRVRRLKSSKTLYFPVYKGDLDHILGWISKQKVLELLSEPNEDFQLAQFLRPVGEVSDETKVSELADIFLKTVSPFLVVKNSQGSTAGIVPLAEFVELVFGFELDTPSGGAATELAAPLLRPHEI
jgi:CBS domain containing-hemolysin-like protein